MVWKSVCCALQGRGHLKKNIPCQDKVTRREENGIHVIVLADGAGSAVFSHFGAECVVNCVAEFILKKFFDLITCEDGHKVKKEFLSVILKSLEEEAMERKCTIKDLASTLLVAAVSDKSFFLAHIGDGVIGYLNDIGLKTVSTPDNGEFANETFFVTSVNAEAHMKIYKGELKKISGFVLMSDGTEQSLYNKRNKTLAPVIKRLLHRTCLIAPEILTPQLEDALGSVVIDNTGYIIQKWTQKETYSGGHERSIYMQVKKYDEDFKKSIVTLYENGKTQSELSREYGVSLSAISRWVRLYSKITTDDGEILTAKQVKALQKRLVQLEEENLILKKAIAIFTPLSNKD